MATMRGRVSFLVLASCGRIGFDPFATAPRDSLDDSAMQDGTDGSAADAFVAACGDGTCSGNSGESCQGCASDCATQSIACGNGVCQTGEDSTSCYDDCGPAVWPATWVSLEDSLLGLINAERAAGTDCPTGMRNPVPALVRDAGMDAISRNHAWDASHRNYNPTGATRCNGVTIFTLLQQAGYTNPLGSATASGSGTAAAVVAGWMSSSTLCPILMDGAFTRLGVGHAAETQAYTNATFD